MKDILSYSLKNILSPENELAENGGFCPDNKFTRNECSNIDVQNLNVFIKDNHILKDINLFIPDNKITCIIGPSGCGKSTFLRTLNRLTDDVEGVKRTGRILINKENILDDNCDITRLRRTMGLVSQRPCPLPMSIFDNVAYGCKIHGIRNKKQLSSIVEYYLKSVALWDEVKERLKSPAARLSIGQQQRLCLARSLAVEPQFILADEATSSLDPVSSRNIESLFVKLKSEYSIILVTHILQQALRIADYVIFMYLGEIIEAGDKQEIFYKPKNKLTKEYISGSFS